MPSIDPRPDPASPAGLRYRSLLLTQRNLTIAMAVFMALPITYAFAETFGAAGAFLLLVTVGVGVPTAYDAYWPGYERTDTALAWIVLAAVVAAVEYTALFYGGVAVLDLDARLASGGAFLLTTAGNYALLAARSRGRRE